MENKKREPLIHITKRSSVSWGKAWLVRIASIVAAVIVCAVITTLFTGDDPIRVFMSIIDGAFGSERKTWITLQNLSILLIISLALTPAFKMRFWNIGGEGQILMGGLAAAACMICLGDKISNTVLIILMVIASLAAGAIWGAIPAIFKAKWGTNETLATLMMNYIAIQLVAYYTVVWEVPKGSGKIGIINQDSAAGWLPEIAGNKYILTISIAVILTAAMYIYFRFSKQGYEISVVGESERTARYVGIKVERVIVRTMIISGAICGLAGLLLVAGINHTITTTITDSQGFTAVMTSWMAQFNPIAMIFSCFLIIFMNRGAGQISTTFGLNHSFSDILTGIILFFIIGSEFFINYKINFRHKQAAGADSDDASKAETIAESSENDAKTAVKSGENDAETAVNSGGVDDADSKAAEPGGGDDADSDDEKQAGDKDAKVKEGEA